MHKPKLVSVSIPTFNSERTIDKCLEAVVNQTYSPIEIILVDAYSTDRTVDIAKKYGAKVYFAKGLTAQRFRCIQESNGEYMLLLDSDQIIAHNLVETCVKEMEREPSLGALILRETSIPMVKGHLARAQSLYLETTQLDVDPIFGSALPRFFRSHVLKRIPMPRHEIGYFDHAWIYAKCRGIKVKYVDHVDIQHLEFNSPVHMARKFFRHYGHYLVPAIVEDPRLVLGKIIPRRLIVFPRKHLTIRERCDQLLLYATKAIFTMLGALYALIKSWVEDGEDLQQSKNST